jgi:hypothetical protein
MSLRPILPKDYQEVSGPMAVCSFRIPSISFHLMIQKEPHTDWPKVHVLERITTFLSIFGNLYVLLQPVVWITVDNIFNSTLFPAGGVAV